MFTTASYTVAKAWKQPKCLPTEQGINKVRCIQTLEHYSATGSKVDATRDHYAK